MKMRLAQPLGWMFAASLPLLACGSTPQFEEASEQQSALTGGTVAKESDYPSTLWMNGCTGAKVGPRHFLTAGHCVAHDDGTLASDKAPGSIQRVTTDNELSNPTWRELHIQSAHVHPLWTTACQAGTCDTVHRPDIGLVIVEEDTPEIPAATIDAVPVAIGDRVVVTGYGCEAGYGKPSPGPGRLKLQAVGSVGGAVLNHAGLGARDLIPYLVGDVVLTPGLEVNPLASSICPGDSGGPLFRESTGEMLLVGVNAYYSFTPDEPALSATNWHTRVDADSNFGVLDWLDGLGVPIHRQDKSSKPFAGSPQDVPDTIPAENYDRGGEGIGYHDSDKLNFPQALFRNDAVDIDSTGDEGGGYNIGGAVEGEWLNYSVNVTAPGPYDLEVRAAAPSDGARLHFEVDGAKLGEAIALANTGDFQRYATVSAMNLPLPAGAHVIRVVSDTAGFNLNWFRFTPSPASPPQDASNGGGGSAGIGGDDVGGTSVGGTSAVAVGGAPAAGTAGAANVGPATPVGEASAADNSGMAQQPAQAKPRGAAGCAIGNASAQHPAGYAGACAALLALTALRRRRPRPAALRA